MELIDRIYTDKVLNYLGKGTPICLSAPNSLSESGRNTIRIEISLLFCIFSTLKYSKKYTVFLAKISKT